MEEIGKDTKHGSVFTSKNFSIFQMSICCPDTYEGEDSRPFSLDRHLKLDSEFQSVYIKKENNIKVDVDFIHKSKHI